MRYFFKFTDGQRTFEDPRGRELPDREAVRASAIRAAREVMQTARYVMKRQLAAERDLSSWKVIVLDAEGKVVLAVPFAEVDDRKPKAGSAEADPLQEP